MTPNRTTLTGEAATTTLAKIAAYHAAQEQAKKLFYGLRCVVSQGENQVYVGYTGPTLKGNTAFTGGKGYVLNCNEPITLVVYDGDNVVGEANGKVVAKGQNAKGVEVGIGAYLTGTALGRNLKANVTLVNTKGQKTIPTEGGKVQIGINISL